MTPIRKILEICDSHGVSVEEAIDSKTMKGANALIAIVCHFHNVSGMQWKDIENHTDLNLKQIRGIINGT